MWRFALPLLLPLLCAPADAGYTHSAATDGQIRTAIENKYDDTGPGAKTPDNAYKTYQNLEDALVAYYDDKDTKLPPAERAIAYHKLVQLEEPKFTPIKSLKSKLPPIYVTRYSFPDKKFFHHDPASQLGVLDLRGLDGLRGLQLDKLKEPVKVKKVRPVKSSPLNLAHYMKNLKLERPLSLLKTPVEEESPLLNSEYTFSYGVHDRHTGDMKAAHETREKGRVRGYYTVMDPDGKQRTVHYTADDKEGFKAVVQRTNTNSQ